MRVRTYVETMSKMANNRDNRPTDPENLTEFLLKRGCIVHKNPVNKYMNFINAFVFVNEHRKRADAVLEGQKLWRTASTQCVLFTEVLDKALLKMERVKNQKGTIKSFFQVVPKVTNFSKI